MATAVKLPRLSAGVGLSPRESKGADPKNKGDDVKAVQALLKLVGIKVGTSGRIDAGTVEAIKSFQKKSGFKYPDGVIDPGQKTWKALTAAVTKKATPAQIEAALGGGESVPVKQFTYKGVTYQLTEKDYDKAVAEVAKKMERLIDALLSQHKGLAGIVQEMLNTIQGSEGLMQSFCAFASAKWAGLDVPQFKSQGTSYSAIMAAKSAIRKKDVKKATDLLPKAQKEILKFERDLNAHRNKLIGASESIVTALEFTRDTSFAIAQEIGTVVLVARGTNPKVAKTSAATFFAALKSGATEVGEHVADPKKTWGGSAQKVLVDSLVAMAGSIIANGFKGSAIKGWAGKLAKTLMTKSPFKQLGPKVTEEYVTKLLTEGGQKVVKDAMTELMKTFGEMTKKGRVPTQQEVEKQLLDYLAGVVGGAAVKKFAAASKKLSAGLLTAFGDKHAKKIGDWFAKLSKQERTKMLKIVLDKSSDEVAKLGFKGAVAGIKGSTSGDKIGTDAAKGAITDKAMIKLLQDKLKPYKK